jgi:hypothetical protein
VSSEALAVTGIVALTEASAAGAAIETVGAVVSAGPAATSGFTAT